MKTIGGISQATMTKFLRFSLGDEFHICKLHKVKGEFQVIISNDVTKEVEEKWISFWKKESVKIAFLRVAESEGS